VTVTNTPVSAELVIAACTRSPTGANATTNCTLAYDGNPASPSDWHTTTNNPPSSAWIRFDLGAAYKVDRVRWVFVTTGKADGMKAQVWQNGAWVSLGTFGNAPADEWQEWTGSKSTQWVRFQFPNPNDDNKVGYLGEVEIWGTPIAGGGGGEDPPPDEGLAAVVAEPSATGEQTATAEPTPDGAPAGDEPGATAPGEETPTAGEPTATPPDEGDKPESEPAVAGQGVIEGAGRDGAACRAAAEAKARVIKTLRNGQAVELVGEAADGWQAVRCGGRVGYVGADLVVDAGEQPGTAPEPAPAEEDAGDEPADDGGQGDGADPDRPLGEVIAGEPAGGGKRYEIEQTTASAEAPTGDVLLDGDAATVWRAEGGGEAWVALHLGKARPVRSVGWQVGPEGLAGTLVVEASEDGKRWRVLGGVDAAEAGAWQTLRLSRTVEARQVRLRFVGGEGASVVGGVAEVEVRGPSGKQDESGRGDAGKGEGERGGGRGEGDRPRAPGRQRRGRRRWSDKVRVSGGPAMREGTGGR
jgi:hypothetical protein